MSENAADANGTADAGADAGARETPETGRPRVKVCGVTTAGDREAVVAAGADALGVVCDVSVDTPREVDPERARELVAGAPPFVTTTLVTMPADAEAGRRLVERVGADAVQIHGLDPDGIERLREQSGRTVIAAVDAATGREDLAAFAAAADAVHLDSTDAGGTGRTHDWERARDLTAALPAPVVLAGGLDPENVTRAVRTVGPYAVDAASGTEREDAGDDRGWKDPDRVRAFVERATVGREADGAGAAEPAAAEGER